MHPFFTDYLNHLQELHGDIRQTLSGLPQTALDWRSTPGMNSQNNLVAHLTGAERYWMGDVVAGQPSGRDREAEFLVHGLTEQEIVQRLAGIDEYIRSVLENMTLADVSDQRISPRNNRMVTVGWVMFHVLKHTALHTGHIQITRQLWDQTQSGAWN